MRIRDWFLPKETRVDRNDDIREIREELLEIQREQALVRAERLDIVEERKKIQAIRDQILSSDSGAAQDAIKAVLEEDASRYQPVMERIIVQAGTQHRNTPLLMAAIQANVPVWIFGDAGSGKTTAALKSAEAVGLPFGFITVCPTSPRSELLGYMDAERKYHRTLFREIYEHGGVFLIDEIDNGNPSTLAVMNTALANGYCAFPDRNVKRHPNTRIVASANTIGRGADVRYIGKNPLDATTLDRFVFVRMDIDDNLEGALVGARFDASKVTNIGEGGAMTPMEWYDYVTKVREVCQELRIDHLISPRATIYGTRLIEAGVGRAHLEEMCIWKGIRSTDKTKILENLKDTKREAA